MNLGETVSYTHLDVYKRQVVMYPAKDLIFFSADVHGSYILQQRLEFIQDVYKRQGKTFSKRAFYNHHLARLDFSFAITFNESTNLKIPEILGKSFPSCS